MIKNQYNRPFPLKQYYLLYAGIGGVLFYLMLFSFIIHAERQALYDQYVQHLIARSNSLYLDIDRDFLSLYGITLSDIGKNNDRYQQELRSEMEHIIKSDFSLSRVKVFDRKGIVLYDHISPENEGAPYKSMRDIGFTTASQGQVSSRLEQNKDGSRWMEVYLPIWNAGKIVGILELYEDVTRFESQVYAALKKSLIVPTIIFIAFNFVLYLIVLKADKIITSQTELLISIRLNMEKYLSRSAIDAIYNAVTRQQELFRGEKMELVIFFSDIRGFTKYSEVHEPENVVKNLNYLFELQAKIIHRRGGMIDKFVGDEIMATFSAQSATDATLAALDIVRAIQTESLAIFEVGISVHAGEAVVGSIGTEDRRDYTAIGNTINTGARLCGASKVGEIIISSTVHEKLTQSIANQFSLSGTLMLKGKAEPIVTYSSLEQGNENILTTSKFNRAPEKSLLEIS